MSATLPYRANADFLESKYVDWKKDPGSVEPLWSSFFEGFELGMARLATKAEAAGAPLSEKTLNFRMRVTNTLHNFRAIGHTAAHLDPLDPEGPEIPALTPAGLGFTADELEEEVQTHMFRNGQPMKLKAMLAELRRIYCGKAGFEFMHIHHPEVRAWLLDRVEGRDLDAKSSAKDQIDALRWLLEAESLSASCTAASSARSASRWKAASRCSWRWKRSRKACLRRAARKSCWAWRIAAVSACWRISCASRWSSVLRIQRELCAEHGLRRWRREVPPRF
jgi:hypothetical protein